MFGVVLDTPREIRLVAAQARQLTFAFQAFLATPYCYLGMPLQRIGHLMPFTATLEANEFDEEMRLLTVWLFIAAGQPIFDDSVAVDQQLGHLTKPDLTSIPMSEEKVLFSQGGDRLQNLVENAAYNEFRHADSDTIP